MRKVLLNFLYFFVFLLSVYFIAKQENYWIAGLFLFIFVFYGIKHFSSEEKKETGKDIINEKRWELYEMFEERVEAETEELKDEIEKLRKMTNIQNEALNDLYGAIYDNEDKFRIFHLQNEYYNLLSYLVRENKIKEGCSVSDLVKEMVYCLENKMTHLIANDKMELLSWINFYTNDKDIQNGNKETILVKSYTSFPMDYVKIKIKDKKVISVKKKRDFFYDGLI